MARSVNTFAASQEACQQRRETIISEYLEVLAKRRVRTEFLTDLAELVARRISEVEGKPCNRGTVLRNNRYREKIADYHRGESSAGANSLSVNSISDPIVKALVVSAQLEGSNSKRELERMKVYVKLLEGQLDAPKSNRVHAQGRSESDETASLVSDFEFRFIRTCQAFRSVLEYLDIVLKVEFSKQQIVDLSKRKHNVVVDKDLAGYFIDWLSAQPPISPALDAS